MAPARGRNATTAAALLATLLAVPVLMGAEGGARRAAPVSPGHAEQAKPPEQARPAPVPPAEYIGSEACALCHEAARAPAMPYHKVLGTGQYKKWGGRERLCEICHGPGKAHAESGDLKLIFSFKQATSARASQECLRCHAQGMRSNVRPLDAHSRNSVGCTTCHSVHAPQAGKLLAGKPENFCVTCHTEVRAEFGRPYRHRLLEGVVGCMDCHNPHGSPNRAQLRRVAGNEIACLKCHGDLRGPFLFEHVPVRTEGCQACHEPHGSVNPRLLTRSEVRLLCLECHTLSKSTLGGPPPAFHDLRSPRFQSCTTCHQKIHGSYVDRVFER